MNIDELLEVAGGVQALVGTDENNLTALESAAANLSSFNDAADAASDQYLDGT